MPSRPLRPCSHPGCRAIVSGGKCPKHAAQALERERQRQADLDARRPSSTARGYDPAWSAVRRQFAAAHPLCCTPGCGRPTEEVDHIIPVREAPGLRLRWSNLRPFCKPCHSRRTAREQGFARTHKVDGKGHA